MIASVVIIWLSVGAVVSLVFFKTIDKLSKKHKGAFSMQEIAQKSAEDHALSQEAIPLLRFIIISALTIGGTIVWPLLGYLLILKLVNS